MNRFRVGSPGRWAGLWTMLAFSGALAAAKPAPAADRPNIVFILADDLGYGDLGCYGQGRIQTPNIDRLAAEGMKFTDFYAGSTVCAPSRCVLMTGLHVGHGLIRGNSKMNLRPEDVTVAEILKKAGYTNGLVGKWGLGHEGSDGVPTRQGFDTYFGYLDQTHAHNYYPTFLMRGETRQPLRNLVPDEGDSGQGVATKKLDYSHDLMAKEALGFLDQNRDRPFFLYLALTIPHANNEAKDEGMEVPDLGIYKDKDWPEPQKAHAAMIGRMDTDLGRLFARLKSLGLDEKTVIFFSSDNGPHREGGNDPDFNDSNGLLRGIKRDLYDGGIRVPMIARWPGRIQAGSTSDLPGTFADIMPTLAQLAGATTPEGLDGLSIVPTLLGQSGQQKVHNYLYWEFYEGQNGQAVRMGDWKAVRKPFSTGPIELFNLKDDVGEAKDVASQHPDIVARVAAAMKEAHVPSPDWKVDGKAEATPKAKKAAKAK